MNNRTVLSAVFSLSIAIVSVAVIALLGAPDRAAPGRIPAFGLPLLAFDAAGIGLAVYALAGSNPKPVNTSLPVRVTALAAAVGIFLNSIAIEIVYASLRAAN